MIKQIQLRGISRTPSDRMSEDGGLSESLNMYLDTAESAPAIVPEDVTEKLGLPADLGAERIFIHKTANYENYIIISTEGLSYKGQEILKKEAGENILITQMGNTLVVTSNLVDNRFYLYKEYEDIYYNVSDIKVPRILFTKESYSGDDVENIPTDGTTPIRSYKKSTQYNDSALDWSSYKEDGQNAAQGPRNVLQEADEMRLSILARNKKLGYLTYPVFVVPTLVLYDGSTISGTPTLFADELKEEIYELGFQTPAVNENYITVRTTSIYRVLAKFYKDDFFKLDRNIVKGLDIYMSDQVALASDYMRLEYDNTYPYDHKWGNFTDNEGALLAGSSLFFKVKSFKWEDFDIGLSKDASHDICANFDFTNLIDSTQLGKETINTWEANSSNASAKAVNYNQKVVFFDTRVSHIPYLANNNLRQLGSVTKEQKKIIFEDHSEIFIKDLDGQNVFTKEYLSSINNNITTPSDVFLILPLSAKRIQTQWTEVITDPDTQDKERWTFFSEGETVPHPFLPMVYVYKRGKNSSTVVGSKMTDTEDYRINSKENELSITKIENPFQVETKHIFQSKITGIAIATTALSQGQFGQFPLYVFTEDGIWAMETAADGSFVSQKPLSREVCINPDSICSIDNAVVFVTDKAVMMIQGSQVMNISPYMNGKHYMPNDSALNLIRNQEGFDTLIGPISDDDPFMSFMKDAKVAYDYTGQRLIFISPSNEGFQYVYKIDTQTWHKLAFSGFDLSTPLNSYPECLVMAERQVPKYLSNILEYTGLKNYDALKDAIKNGKELNKIQMAEEPFPGEVLEQLDVPLVKQEAINYFWWKIVVRETRDVAPSKAERDNLMRLTKWSAKELDDALLGKEIRADLYFPEDYWGDVEMFLNKFFEYEIEDGIDEGLVCIKYIIGEVNEDAKNAKVYSLSTVLDASTTQDTAKGILITRPFDLGEPDVYKSITSIKIRGDFDKGNVKYILQGSDDGRTFYTLSSLRGKSWKMFRIFILADLEPTERISWIDIDFEPRYQNKLR